MTHPSWSRIPIDILPRHGSCMATHRTVSGSPLCGLQIGGFTNLTKDGPPKAKGRWLSDACAIDGSGKSFVLHEEGATSSMLGTFPSARSNHLLVSLGCCTALHGGGGFGGAKFSDVFVFLSPLADDMEETLCYKVPEISSGGGEGASLPALTLPFLEPGMLSPELCPSPQRLSHAGAAIGDYTFVSFGGLDASSAEPSGDLHIFNLHGLPGLLSGMNARTVRMQRSGGAISATTLPAPSAAGLGYTCHTIKSPGHPALFPQARYLHSMSVMGGNGIVTLYGGCGGSKYSDPLSDLWFLLPQPPIARAAGGAVRGPGPHSSLSFPIPLLSEAPGNGSSIGAVETSQELSWLAASWCRPSARCVSGLGPGKLWGHTLTHIEGTNSFILFGGSTWDLSTEESQKAAGDGDGHAKLQNDIYILTVLTLLKDERLVVDHVSWSKAVLTVGPGPSPRWRHSAFWLGASAAALPASSNSSSASSSSWGGGGAFSTSMSSTRSGPQFFVFGGYDSHKESAIEDRECCAIDIKALLSAATPPIPFSPGHVDTAAIAAAPHLLLHACKYWRLPSSLSNGGGASNPASNPASTPSTPSNSAAAAATANRLSGASFSLAAGATGGGSTAAAPTTFSTFHSSSNSTSNATSSSSSFAAYSSSFSSSSSTAATAPAAPTTTRTGHTPQSSSSSFNATSNSAAPIALPPRPSSVTPSLPPPPPSVDNGLAASKVLQNSLFLAEAELDRLRDDFTRVSAERDAKRIAWEEEKRSLEADLQSKEASLEQLRASLSGEKQSLEGRMKAGEEGLTALRAELLALSSAKDAARIEWEKERDELQHHIQVREGSLKQLREECLRVASERDSVKHAWEEEKRALELRLKSREESLEAKLKEVAALQHDLTEAEEQLKQNMCIVCEGEPRTNILDTCGHIVFCDRCADEYEQRGRQASNSAASPSSSSADDIKCPICTTVGRFCKKRGSKDGERLHAFIPSAK